MRFSTSLSILTSLSPLLVASGAATSDEYPNCHENLDDYADKIGDGICSMDLNSAECGFDGGKIMNKPKGGGGCLLSLNVLEEARYYDFIFQQQQLIHCYLSMHSLR